MEGTERERGSGYHYAKRLFEFAGNELTLTVVPARNARLTWRRVGG